MASWGENALIVLLLRMCAIDYNQRATMSESANLNRHDTGSAIGRMFASMLLTTNGELPQGVSLFDYLAHTSENGDKQETDRTL
ncbi:hypothetical protein HBI25_062800 [Parastagonospora nodorum]|nr:hypothetical protein HBI09_165660 [Parastagonospora nodorum]KAH4069876.1 hypothetical protein HBH50_105650 [Parastagonospora nodorum]KAH4090283.1 hypothetical protein HBH48_109420 [Parastagonospora nodorum]KAH4961757.1 hypothetical protein HBI78_143140 [Parastagonospora nodorum]KAH5117961.1 hypothetical protein HBH71_104450 [Parastagonospora nodorum]